MTSPLPQNPVAIPVPLAPLLKADVARTLGVSTRTIEMWSTQGLMPAPARIGGRVYWHPATFYAWLDKRLRVPDSACEGAVWHGALPATATDGRAAAAGIDAKREAKKKNREAVTSLAGERALRRSSTLLESLNAAC